LLSGDWVLPFSELKMGPELGRGGFGVVYKAEWRHQDVAVKQLSMSSLTEKQIQDFKAEVELMRKLRPHENIVGFRGLVVEPHLCLVTELMHNGSVETYCRSHKVDDELLLRFCLDTARGMIHLHAEGIVHRDLAARNLLLSKNLDVKITDFGFARVLQDVNEGNTKSNIGPLRWMAPEAIKRRAYSAKSDVFSFACTWLEMATGAVPWGESEAPTNVVLRVCNGERPDIPQGRSAFWTDLLNHCWGDEPDSRFTFLEIYDYLKSCESQI